MSDRANSPAPAGGGQDEAPLPSHEARESSRDAGTLESGRSETSPLAAPRHLARVALRWIRAGPEVRRLVLLALVVRIAAAALSPAILNDSVSLMRGAARIADQGGGALWDLPHHPLPVLAFAALHRLGCGEIGATLTCAAAGALAVWPLHTLARRACGRHAATAVGLVYACLPKAVEVSSLPLAEGPYLLCLLGALSLTAAARDAGRRTLPRLAGAGVVAALAYLCRPEGLIALPVAVAAGGLDGRPGRWRRVGVVAATFLLVAAPYVALLSHARGRFTLTPKKDIVRFVGLAEPVAGVPSTSPPVPAPWAPDREDASTRLVTTLRGTASALESAFTVPVGVVVLLGLLSPRRWRRRRARRPRLLLVGTATLLIALVVRLEAGWGYSGGRHALGAAVLLLPFVGQGLATLGAVFRRNTSRRRFAVVAATALAIPLGVQPLLRPVGASGVGARRLGEAIALQFTTDGPGIVRVATVAEPLVAYYAEQAGAGVRCEDVPLWGRFARPLERGADAAAVVDALAAELRSGNVTWIVLDVENPTERTLGEGLRNRGVLAGRALGAGSTLTAFPLAR